MSAKSRYPAVPASLALLIGAGVGIEIGWAPPGYSVALAALGMAWRCSSGRIVAFMALGVLLGAQHRPARWTPDLRRPVLVEAETTGAWLDGEFGLRAPAAASWLRQGQRIESWYRPLTILLPPGEPPPMARRLRLTGYLRPPVGASNGVPSRLPPWQLRIKASAFVSGADSRKLSPRRMIHDLSYRLRSRLERQLVAEESRWPWRTRLVEALILGRTTAMPDSVLRSLRALGLLHLFALSGLHVGLLAASVSQLTIGARTGLRIAVILTLILVYGLIGGDRPSLIRASLMLCGALGSRGLRRPAQAINTLAWVAAAMVSADPQVVADLGFQLSVAATAGILLLAPVLYRRWTLLPGWLGLPLSVSTAAHLAGMPWTLSVFHLASPWSPILFLAVLPWTIVTLALAFGWTALAMVWPAACGLLDPWLERAGILIGWLAELAFIPRLVFPTAIGIGGALTATAVVVLLLLGSRQRLSLAGLAIALSSTSGVTADLTPELTVLDVGQGDAILLRDRGEALLIDGGGWYRGDIGQKVVAPALARLGVRRLAGVVLTHPDVDHCRGVLDLLSYMPVERLYLSAGWRQSECLDRVLTSSGLRASPLWRAQKLALGRWQLTTLHPGAGQRTGRNNRSIVFRALVHQRQVVLTGDLERSGELEILQFHDADDLGGVDLLKVGHHGSATSTSAAWLSRLTPRLAIVSCGASNRYGHPAAVVLERLAGKGARVLRTDRDGGVRIRFPEAGPLQIEFLARP